MGLLGALNTASRSLEIFSTGIQVAGNNVANANTPGYVREDLTISTAPDVRHGRALVGMGAQLEGVRLQIDRYLESRLHAANSDLAAAEARQYAYGTLEGILAELGDGDLSTSLNNFLGALNEFANQPELAGLREVAVQNGVQFAQSVTTLRSRLDRQRDSTDVQLGALVAEANELIDRVETLNVKIVQLEGGGALGSHAGALRSERLKVLDRLSEIIPIKVQEQETGRVDVISGGEYLILGQAKQHLEVHVSNEGGAVRRMVRFSESKFEELPAGGEIRGLIDGRDQVLGGFIERLDTYVSTFLHQFNRIHSSGQGSRLYQSLAAENRVEDASAVLDAAGLKFAPEHGSFEIQLRNVATGAMTTSVIQIDLDGMNGDDTTLSTLAASLDSVANLTASVTTDGRLQLGTAAGYEFAFANDDSGVLASLGLNAFFTGHDSATIGVREAVRLQSDYFAGGRGGGAGDGSNAVALIGLMDVPQAGLGGGSFDQYYQRTMSAVAQASAAERALVSGYADFHDSLASQREQISGVSLDEETIRIMQYQHSFASMAKIIQTLDELLSTLIAL